MDLHEMPSPTARDVATRQYGPMTDPESLQRLLAVRMPYGKYKDSPIADLPGAYLDWFARQGFPRGELGRLLALMHEIDTNGLRGLLAPLRAGGPGRGTWR